MTKKVLFQVTEQHLLRGIRNSSTDCMFALCAKETLKTEKVSVKLGALYYGQTGGCVLIPDNVAGRILDYDHGLPVEPFSVELDINVDAVN